MVKWSSQSNHALLIKIPAARDFHLPIKGKVAAEVVARNAQICAMAKSRKGRFSFRRWGPGVASAARSAFKTFRSRTNTRTRGSKRSYPLPITGESDFRSVYKRKRYPRGRKKRWVGFVRKVKHVIHKSVAPQFNVLLRNLTVAQAAGTQACNDIFTVLGSNSAVSHFADIAYLFERALANRIPDNALLPLTIKQNMRLVVSGWMAECCISNTGETLVYLDCYYWRCKRNVKKETLALTNLFAQSLADVNENMVATATETGLSITDYGVTPFQGVEFAKCINIWKKTRIKIGPGGTTQLEMRSGKDHVRNFSFDEDYSMLAGVTEGIFFIQYGAPGVLTPQTSGSTLVFSTNTNYTWRVVQDNRMKGMHDQP